MSCWSWTNRKVTGEALKVPSICRLVPIQTGKRNKNVSQAIACNVVPNKLIWQLIMLYLTYFVVVSELSFKILCNLGCLPIYFSGIAYSFRQELQAVCLDFTSLLPAWLLFSKSLWFLTPRISLQALPHNSIFLQMRWQKPLICHVFQGQLHSQSPWCQLWPPL